VTRTSGTDRARSVASNQLGPSGSSLAISPRICVEEGQQKREYANFLEGQIQAQKEAKKRERERELEEDRKMLQRAMEKQRSPDRPVRRGLVQPEYSSFRDRSSSETHQSEANERRTDSQRSLAPSVPTVDARSTQSMLDSTFGEGVSLVTAVTGSGGSGFTPGQATMAAVIPISPQHIQQLPRSQPNSQTSTYPAHTSVSTSAGIGVQLRSFRPLLSVHLRLKLVCSPVWRIDHAYLGLRFNERRDSLFRFVSI